jgi:hypothetical protein
MSSALAWDLVALRHPEVARVLRGVSKDLRAQMEPFCDPLSPQTFDMDKHVHALKRRFEYVSVSRLAAERDELDWVVHPRLLAAIAESPTQFHLEFMPECTCCVDSHSGRPHYAATSFRRRHGLCNNLGKYLREPTRLISPKDNRCRWVHARLAFIKAAKENLAKLRCPALVRRFFEFPSHFAAEKTRCETSLLQPYGALVALKTRGRSRGSRKTVSLPDKDMEPVYHPVLHVGGGPTPPPDVYPH